MAHALEVLVTSVVHQSQAISLILKMSVPLMMHSGTQNASGLSEATAYVPGACPIPLNTVLNMLGTKRISSCHGYFNYDWDLANLGYRNRLENGTRFNKKTKLKLGASDLVMLLLHEAMKGKGIKRLKCFYPKYPNPLLL